MFLIDTNMVNKMDVIFNFGKSISLEIQIWIKFEYSYI